MAKSAPKFVKASAPAEATLEKIRQVARDLRDKKLEIANVESRLSELKAERLKIEFEKLPEMYDAAGIDSLGIPKEGNQPAYDGKLKPFYRANISADWEPEKRDAAFKWLIKNGHGDLIKTEIVIRLGRGDVKLLNDIKKRLKPLMKKIDITVGLNVPWNTLTAFVKEQIEEKKAILPLDILGAQVGKIVELKPRKE